MKPHTWLWLMSVIYLILAGYVVLFGIVLSDDDSTKSEVIFWGCLSCFWITSIGSNILKRLDK